MCGPGQLSPCSNLLWAGRSGDRILAGARISVPIQTSPGVHPVSYTMGTGSFQGTKQPGRDVDHPPPFSTEVKEYGCTYTPPLGLRGLLRGKLYFIRYVRIFFGNCCKLLSSNIL